MFNNSDERKPVPVQLALSDGRKLEGKLMLPPTMDIKRVLNSDGASLEFESRVGVQSLVTKSAVVEITLTDTVKARASAPQTTEPLIDPYELLGITRSVSVEHAKAAFDTLRAQYHSDRYAGTGLPDDVLAYMRAKSQQIDAAYAMIERRVAGEAS